jgi:predicted RNase H-like HicB family nuclease
VGEFWLAKSFITLVFGEMDKFEMKIYWREDDGSFLVEVPELSGCMADGKTYKEAVRNAEIAIKMWIRFAKELGREIPTPKSKLMFA